MSSGATFQSILGHLWKTVRMQSAAHLSHLWFSCPRSLPSHWQNVLFWNFRSVSDELCFWWLFLIVTACSPYIYIYICLYLPDPYRNQTGWTCSSECCAHLCGLGSAQTPHMQKLDIAHQWLLKNKRCFSINIRNFPYLFPIMCACTRERL